MKYTVDRIESGFAVCYDDNKNWICKNGNLKSTPYTFETPDNCYFIQIQYMAISTPHPIHLEYHFI